MYAKGRGDRFFIMLKICKISPLFNNSAQDRGFYPLQRYKPYVSMLSGKIKPLQILSL